MNGLTSKHVAGGTIATVPRTNGLNIIWMICFATLMMSVMFALLRFVPRKEQ